MELQLKWTIVVLVNLLWFNSNGQAVEIIDLSYDLNNETIYWPTSIPFQLFIKHRGLVDPDLPESDSNYWYELNEFKMSEHCGTHLDAPVHFHRGGWSVDQIPSERFISPVSIVDLRHSVKNDADYRITTKDLQTWESITGKTLDPIIILWTGWSSRWPNRLLYLGTDSNDTSLLRFPSLHPEAARWLVNNRRVHGIGIDTASVDPGNSRTALTHRILATNNIFNLENVNTVPLIERRLINPYLVVNPLKIGTGSGSPIRPIIISALTSSAAKSDAKFIVPLFSLTFYTALLVSMGDVSSLFLSAAL